MILQLDSHPAEAEIALVYKAIDIPWPIWRVWQAGRDSLADICEKWNFQDLLTANYVLTAEAKIQQILNKKVK